MPGYWQSKKVFVTGCTGLLGPWLIERLLSEGAEVVGLVRDQVPASNFYLLGLQRKIVVVHGDITDSSLIERSLNEYEIDTVFHLAAQAIVLAANRSPVSTLDSNIRGTWSLLEAARHSQLVKRIVVASSDKAYGDHRELPYRESTPLCPTNFYDVSKASADLIAQAYYKNYGLPLAVVRCGNLYGGGDLNFNRLIPGTIQCALRGEAPLIRSNGKYIRDYFYVQDATEAYLRVAERLEGLKSVAGEAFNVSNEEPATVLEVVQRILRLMDREQLQPIILGNASGEIVDQYLSSEKAREVLGWRAKYSLDEGLSQSIAWYRAFFQRNEMKP